MSVLQRTDYREVIELYTPLVIVAAGFAGIAVLRSLIAVKLFLLITSAMLGLVTFQRAYEYKNGFSIGTTSYVQPTVAAVTIIIFLVLARYLNQPIIFTILSLLVLIGFFVYMATNE